MKFIKDLNANEEVLIDLLVIDVTRGIGGNRNQYFSVSLQDSTGRIEGKKWEIAPEDNEIFVQGNIVELEASVVSYRDSLQLKILNAVKLNPNEVDITRFEKSAPLPLDEMKKELTYYIKSIKNENCSKIVCSIFDKYYESILIYPAAISNHHEFTSGLLYHTISMAKAGEALAKLYPSINYDILMSGILLHDVGKIYELSGPVIPKYTTEGKLIGHISLMDSIIRETAEVLHVVGEESMLLEHLILSHHGKMEYGSPVLPLTREAIILNFVDDIDAKMMILDKAYDGVEPGEFTDRIFAFDGRKFYKPKF